MEQAFKLFHDKTVGLIKGFKSNVQKLLKDYHKQTSDFFNLIKEGEEIPVEQVTTNPKEKGG